MKMCKWSMVLLAGTCAFNLATALPAADEQTDENKPAPAEEQVQKTPDPAPPTPNETPTPPAVQPAETPAPACPASAPKSETSTPPPACNTAKTAPGEMTPEQEAKARALLQRYTEGQTATTTRTQEPKQRGASIVDRAFFGSRSRDMFSVSSVVVTYQGPPPQPKNTEPAVVQPTPETTPAPVMARPVTPEPPPTPAAPKSTTKPAVDPAQSAPSANYTPESTLNPEREKQAREVLHQQLAENNIPAK